MSGRRRDARAALRLPAPLAGDLAGAAPARLGPVRRIAEVWEAVVGEALARVAQPARVARDGTLVVHAADASWVHAITLEQRTILRRLGEALGGDAPTALRVEVGPVSVAEPTPEAAPVVVPEAVQRRAEELAAGAEDPVLRGVLERAIAATLARGKTL